MERNLHNNKGPHQATVERYSEALELYGATDMPMAAICRLKGVSLPGFRSYLRRFHSDMLFARHGLTMPQPEASKTRLRKSSGQTAAAHLKYRDAIEACDSREFIGLNISQIAHRFHLDPSSLGKQLRRHYPEILERRERERRRLAIADNLPRGVDPRCREQYAPAVAHLQAGDDTIARTAELFGLSYSGLREHLLFYNKRLAATRAGKRREAATSDKAIGRITGNGAIHAPSAENVGKYAEALSLYRTTAMTQREICAATGVSITGLRNHLRIWNRDLMSEHYDVDGRGNAAPRRYLRSTAAKYAAAIARLKATGQPAAAAAREFGLNADSFRSYLKEHEPGLAASLGMTRLANGRTGRAGSAEKYAEAIRAYETSTETLKSIAARMGLKYNSLGGYVRRSRPDAIEAHNRLLTLAASRAG